MATATTKTGLYHEVRGTGPALLLIPGAAGDGGQFTRTAERLADEFSVITYDRRGNSRSVAQGDPMRAATIAAQAADAAALIRECGFEQAVVLGTSGGATITLELIAREPQVVKGAVVHEPPLIALLPPADGPNPLQALMDQSTRDPEGALEKFLRVNAGDAGWNAIDGATRERMLGNSTTLFHRELGHFAAYRPDERVLRSLPSPVALLLSRDGLPYAPAVMSWLEEATGLKAGVLTGGHAPYLDQPDRFAEEVRPLVRRLAAA
jgi:pimeloyl-ACP methyl ester carboxylesterase